MCVGSLDFGNVELLQRDRPSSVFAFLSRRKKTTGRHIGPPVVSPHARMSPKMNSNPPLNLKSSNSDVPSCSAQLQTGTHSCCSKASGVPTPTAETQFAKNFHDGWAQSPLSVITELKQVDFGALPVELVPLSLTTRRLCHFLEHSLPVVCATQPAIQHQPSQSRIPHRDAGFTTLIMRSPTRS